jgi:hypothetical protein
MRLRQEGRAGRPNGTCNSTEGKLRGRASTQKLKVEQKSHCQKKHTATQSATICGSCSKARMSAVVAHSKQQHGRGVSHSGQRGIGRLCHSTGGDRKPHTHTSSYPHPPHTHDGPASADSRREHTVASLHVCAHRVQSNARLTGSFPSQRPGHTHTHTHTGGWVGGMLTPHTLAHTQRLAILDRDDQRNACRVCRALVTEQR